MALVSMGMTVLGTLLCSRLLKDMLDDGGVGNNAGRIIATSWSSGGGRDGRCSARAVSLLDLGTLCRTSSTSIRHGESGSSRAGFDLDELSSQRIGLELEGLGSSRTSCMSCTAARAYTFGARVTTLIDRREELEGWKRGDFTGMCYLEIVTLSVYSIDDSADIGIGLAAANIGQEEALAGCVSWKLAMLGKVIVLGVDDVPFSLADVDGPAGNTAPCLHLVELVIDQEELSLIPVLGAPILLTLVVLAAVLDPAIFRNLMSATLVAAEDVRDDFSVIT